jgi:phospholipase/carboxylesterase
MDRESSPIVIEPSGAARSAVIWLHGLGADGYDFVPIVDELGLPDEFGTRFVLPHAAERPVTVNGGMVMRAWYDILEIDIDRRVDQAQIEASADAVLELVENEINGGIPAERLVLAGFSQGGVVALQAGLRCPRRLAGIIGLSCYLPDADGLAARRSHANVATPVFLAHGRHDPLVPMTLGRAALAAVTALGNPVTWHDYPMEHAVCADQIDDLRLWFGDVLAPTGG